MRRVFTIVLVLCSVVLVRPADLVLTWTDNSDNEDGFRMERAIGADGSFAEVATIPANAITWTDAGLSAGTFYRYRLRAFNAYGFSDYSNTAEATTVGVLINAPGGLQANPIGEPPPIISIELASYEVPSTSETAVGYTKNSQEIAQQFVAAQSGIISEVELPIYLFGSLVADATVAIYSDDPVLVLPSVGLGTSSSVVRTVDIPKAAGADKVVFRGLEVQVVAGTTYWLALNSTSYGSASNCIKWPRASTPSKVVQRGPGSAWATLTTSRRNLFRILGEASP